MTKGELRRIREDGPTACLAPAAPRGFRNTARQYRLFCQEKDHAGGLQEAKAEAGLQDTRPGMDIRPMGVRWPGCLQPGSCVERCASLGVHWTPPLGVSTGYSRYYSVLGTATG